METNRLIFRALTPEDASCLYGIYQHQGVLQYFPNPKPPSLAKVMQSIEAQQDHWHEHGYGNWAVVEKGSSNLMGWAGLQYLPELNETEVGFLLDNSFWGKGYATEAAEASLQYGFERGLKYLVGLVHPENVASRRVLEKCGLVYDRSLQIWGINLMHYCIEKTSPRPAQDLNEDAAGV